MVRIRTPLRLIEPERHRSYAFQRRREVLKKKTMELGELCGIVTLLVCFGPGGQLVTWPEDPEEVRGIIQSYRRVGLDGDGVKRRYDLAGFFEDHLKRLQRELGLVRDAWLSTLPMGSLEELMRSLDSRLAAVEESIGRAQIEEKEQETPATQFPRNPLPSVENINSSTDLDVQPLKGFDSPDFHNVRPELLEDVVGFRRTSMDLQSSDMQQLWNGLGHSPPGPSPLLPPVQGGCFDLGITYLGEHLVCDFMAHSAAGEVFYPTMPCPTNVCRYSSLHGSGDVGCGGLQFDNAPLFEHSAFSFVFTEFATFLAARDSYNDSLRDLCDGGGGGGGGGGVHLPSAPSFEPSPISYLSTDSGTLPAPGDLGQPTMAFPLTFCHDGPLGSWDHPLGSHPIQEPSTSSLPNLPRHLPDDNHSAELCEAEALRGEFTDLWPLADAGSSFVFPDPLPNALCPAEHQSGCIW